MAAGNEGPRVRFHDLRHTHAAWLIAGDTPIPNVTERLGHAKTLVTFDTYAHVVDATCDHATPAVAALLFGPVTAENEDADAVAGD